MMKLLYLKESLTLKTPLVISKDYLLARNSGPGEPDTKIFCGSSLPFNFV